MIKIIRDPPHAKINPKTDCIEPWDGSITIQDTDKMVNAADATAMVEEGQKIVAAIKPLLSGKGPHIQGAVLVELVALWLAGHEPKSRTGVLALWLGTLDGLTPIMENEIFGGGPRPEGWND